MLKGDRLDSSCAMFPAERPIGCATVGGAVGGGGSEGGVDPPPSLIQTQHLFR